MDYSLLVGVHHFHHTSPFFHPLPGERIKLFSLFTSENTMSSIAQLLPNKILENEILCDFYGGMRGSDPFDSPIDEVYFFGIIDFLQGYSIGKNAEHLIKSMVYSEDTMSCIAPEPYADRLFAFICREVAPPIGKDLDSARRRTRFNSVLITPFTPRSNSTYFEEPHSADEVKIEPSNSKTWKNHKKLPDVSANPELAQITGFDLPTQNDSVSANSDDKSSA